MMYERLDNNGGVETKNFFCTGDMTKTTKTMTMTTKTTTTKTDHDNNGRKTKVMMQWTGITTKTERTMQNNKLQWHLPSLIHVNAKFILFAVEETL